MSYGPVQAFPSNFASGATSSSYVDLGKAYANCYVELQSATTFNLVVQGSSDAVKFKRIYHAVSDNDAVVTNVEITSATAGANGAIVKVPCSLRYMRLEALTAVADGMACKIIGSD